LAFLFFNSHQKFDHTPKTKWTSYFKKKLTVRDFPTQKKKKSKTNKSKDGGNGEDGEDCEDDGNESDVSIYLRDVKDKYYN
jgi:hypothetical protein